MIDTFSQLLTTIHTSPLTYTLMAITDKDVDIIGNVQKAFANFVSTGQVWALIIGVVVGYMFRGFTSY